MGVSISVFQSQFLPLPQPAAGTSPGGRPRYVRHAGQSRNATCSIAWACDSVFITTLCQYGSFTVAWSGWRIWPRT
jgi:hypothetical protein